MLDQPPAIIEIASDFGGTLGERAVIMGWLKRSGVQVRIVGTCISACALLFALPRDKICVSRGARIGHHTAPGEAHDRILWERGRDLIARGFARACRAYR